VPPRFAQFTLAAHSNSLPVMNARWNMHLHGALGGA
jgi:hypothetical protein